MNPIALILAAAAAWWLYTRQAEPDRAPPQIAATSSVFTHQGRTYRVVGPPNEAGLVPVQYRPPEGVMAAQVIQWFDPVTGAIVPGPTVTVG